jgi:hypothetical protein
MYIVHIITSGIKERMIPCSTENDAQTCANMYWHDDPIIVEEGTGRIIPVRLAVSSMVPSEL